MAALEACHAVLRDHLPSLGWAASPSSAVSRTGEIGAAVRAIHQSCHGKGQMELAQGVAALGYLASVGAGCDETVPMLLAVRRLAKAVDRANPGVKGLDLRLSELLRDEVARALDELAVECEMLALGEGLAGRVAGRAEYARDLLRLAGLECGAALASRLTDMGHRLAGAHLAPGSSLLGAVADAARLLAARAGNLDRAQAARAEGGLLRSLE